jgi:signal transduction histidine kinase
VHDLSHQLHPSKLEQLGLVASVRGLCKELTQSHGLPVAFTHDGFPEVIPEDAALCLYRIVQEALRNVLKHSGARHARVELSRSGEMMCLLQVVDDGAGFDPGSIRAREGLGLVSMRERLHLVNGSIVITSRPSGGTRIEVRVPLGATGPTEGVLKEQPARVE